MKILLSILLLFLSFAGIAQLNPLVIGVIHFGDSIVIKYDATINNPLVPPNAPSISNQETVSGSNFSNVLTDDPDTGPTADPTITSLNLFPLPVTLTELKAFQSGNHIALNWKVAAEYNLLKYEIERSNDGLSFTKIGEVAARNSAITTEYSYTDLQPFSGYNYYRVRMVDMDGTKKYSVIAKVKIGGAVQAITIFPNPVAGFSINVQIQNMPAGKFTARLYNLHGHVIMTKLFNHQGESATEIIYLPNTAGKGLYQLEISNSEIKKTFKLVIL